MDVYKIPIEYAFIVFPFIAFILTIPFLLYQYRKFGSISLLKSTFFYSMILYIICAYFLVILPLPSKESVVSMTGPTLQLVPFQFIKDIFSPTVFDITNFYEFINILKKPTVYIVLFNIALTLPFGVYLRYFFKTKWYHTIIYSFFLSLFFELTQLTGLYGLYPRPYRLFDVDDLIINTIGGILGYAITPVLTFFLPTIDEIEKKSYKDGEKITLVRRGVSLIIDILFTIILSILARVLLYGTILEEYNLLLVLIIFYVLIPSFSSGKTFGKRFIKMKISGFYEEAKWYQIFCRYLMLTFIILYPYSWINLIDNYIPKILIKRIWHIVLFCQCINTLYYIYTFLAKKEHLFLYEYITETKNISIIDVVCSNENIDGDSTEDKIAPKEKI